jgi:hypothetical protein
MFVFWYSHKRGKEVRLARESAESQAHDAESKEEAHDGSDYDATDSDEGEIDDAAEKIAEAVKADSTESKEDVLNQPEPAQVPLPDAEKGEKGAALEAEKSVGV